jgi:hypothetical protein
MPPIDDLTSLPKNLLNLTLNNVGAPLKSEPTGEKENPKSKEKSDKSGAELDAGVAAIREETNQLRRSLFNKFQKINGEEVYKHSDKETPAKNHKEANSKQSKEILLDIPEMATLTGVFRRGLMKHAARAGLSLQEQGEFAEKQIKKFAEQAKAKGLEGKLEKVGDLSNVGEFSQLFQAEVKGNQVKLTLSDEIDKELNDLQRQTFVRLNGSLNNAQVLQNKVIHHNARHAAELRFQSIAASPTARFGEIKTVINNKAEAILKQIGVSVEALKNNAGEAKSIGAAPLDSKFIGAATDDNALFATALGIAAESGSESRALNGDGLLLEFVNYGAETITSDDKAILNILQNGTSAGVNNLIEAANADFSDFAIEGLAEIKNSLEVESPTNLVVGLITMSVMTREVVDQLTHVLNDASLGLSDSAMSALQKAQNSLRDHLGTNDLVGALAEVKNCPVSVEGLHYNFLPEVNEALNALRDARTRVLSEAAAVKSDLSGVDSQTRYVREADALLGVTQRVESFLKTR